MYIDRKLLYLYLHLTVCTRKYCTCMAVQAKVYDGYRTVNSDVPVAVWVQDLYLCKYILY